MSEQLQNQQLLELAPAAELQQGIQTEQNSFMQDVLARGRRLANYAAVMGGSVLALGGVTGVSESEAKANNDRPEWPPITQKIDGFADWIDENSQGTPESIEKERAFAASCKPRAFLVVPAVGKFRKSPKKPRNILTVFYQNPSITVCNGYGRLTTTIRIDTKYAGQKRYVRGVSYAIRDHRAFPADLNKPLGAKYMKIGQPCKKGKKITARMVSINSWEDINHKVHKQTRIAPAERGVSTFKCP